MHARPPFALWTASLGFLLLALACDNGTPSGPELQPATPQFAKEKGQGKGTVEPIPLQAVFRDLEADLLRSDAEIPGWEGNSVYVNGLPSDVYLMSNGNFKLDVDPTDCWKRKRCGGHRLYVADLPGLVEFPHVHGYMTTSRPSLENGFRALLPGESMVTHLFVYFGHYWNGSELVQLEDGYSLQYGGACGAENPHPEHRVLVTAGNETGEDGNPVSWTVEAAAGPVDLDNDGIVDLTLTGHALLCTGSPWAEVAELDAPFAMTLTKLGG